MVRWPYGVGRVGKVRLTFKKLLLDFRCFRPSFTTLLSLLLCLVATLLSSFLIFLYSLFWFRRRRILVQCGDHLRLMLSFIWALTQRCLFLVGFQFKGAQTYRGEVLNTVPHLIRKQSRPFLTWKVTLYNYTNLRKQNWTAPVQANSIKTVWTSATLTPAELSFLSTS